MQYFVSLVHGMDMKTLSVRQKLQTRVSFIIMTQGQSLQAASRCQAIVTEYNSHHNRPEERTSFKDFLKL